MDKETLEVWLRDREPRIPEPFLPLLLEEGAGSAGSEDLLAQGTEALRRVLERPGRNRESAFHLLTADAFLTYSCEAVVREGDVSGGLEKVFEGLVESFR